MEVGDDLHRPIREEFEDILLDECLADSFELFELELRPEMVENRVGISCWMSVLPTRSSSSSSNFVRRWWRIVLA
ncbi:hypothetical protein C451_20415 [Halococcus thailandensis JCM 13552]|uniref:Uncharacterized protein n=1 Tax=Halococcus thailandensis JCM 13552 TaxID=1227457 RepID=M0MRT9_9EURY|nr:hypothetical protein C451_20415 [Halococcus thailandensis JCM 13552]